MIINYTIKPRKKAWQFTGLFLILVDAVGRVILSQIDPDVIAHIHIGAEHQVGDQKAQSGALGAPDQLSFREGPLFELLDLPAELGDSGLLCKIIDELLLFHVDHVVRILKPIQGHDDTSCCLIKAGFYEGAGVPNIVWILFETPADGKQRKRLRINIRSPYLLHLVSPSDLRVGCFSSMQVSWLAHHRWGAFSDCSNGLAFALRLQWRDRTGL